MNIQEIVKNEIVQDNTSVWVLKNHDNFDYSEGREAEKYLENVFNSAEDLSSRSSELETSIRDWSSEYHLSVKRAQLFSGFDFDSSLKVLEVGCGCGAISRFLGETFNEVVSIEGSISRAKLARLRTRDLPSVTILCAPFQEIEFNQKFDIIFCIGVYEYSSSFVSGPDPYDLVLDYFSKMLSPNGSVVIAIENQFGLKYFNTSREDHVARLYEGLEGYHTHHDNVRTFGKAEIEENLKKYFPVVNFYYPYPDYKIPDCIVSDEFLSSKRAGELVSQFKSRDYGGDLPDSWDESLVSLELSKNGMLPFFSNSFLIIANKSDKDNTSFNQMASVVTSHRCEMFRTQTRVTRSPDDTLLVSKSALSNKPTIRVGNLSLVESSSVWREGDSVHTKIYKNCKSNTLLINEIFQPAKLWVDFLEGNSELSDSEKFLPGEYLDCIWSNVYDENGEIIFIDKEWVWLNPIKLKVVVIRAIFNFLFRIKNTNQYSNCLSVRSTKKLIISVARSIGVSLSDKDFIEFVSLESEFQSIVSGTERQKIEFTLKWLLVDKPSYYLISNGKMTALSFLARLKGFIGRFL